MTTLTTTLNRIREHAPCAAGWEKLLKHLGKTQADDEPLTFATIVESNGLDDALWACRSAPEYSREWRLFAVWCARQVQHLMTDPRSLAVLDVAERYASGQATDDELGRAQDDAWDAVRAARDAARDAAQAARAAARDDAWAAAQDAAWDAAWAAARASARDAVQDAVHSQQRLKFLEIVGRPGRGSDY